MKPTLSSKHVAVITGLTLSAWGVSHITQEEGIRYKAYLDTVEVWTICVGHTGMTTGNRVMPGDVATKAECAELLKKDSDVFVKAVKRCVTSAVSQRQFDLLVGFAFNIGATRFCTSTFVKLFNTGACKTAAKQILLFRRGGAGIPARRERMYAMFFEDCVR